MDDEEGVGICRLKGIAPGLACPGLIHLSVGFNQIRALPTETHQVAGSILTTGSCPSNCTVLTVVSSVKGTVLS